jgi:hypothetical protein
MSRRAGGAPIKPAREPESRGEQAKNIGVFVEAMTGRKPAQLGEEGSEVDYKTLFKWMKQFKEGTVFAISASKKGMNGHWLNAVLQNGEVTFIDFQPNRHVMNLPSSNKEHTGTSPFTGIILQRSFLKKEGKKNPLKDKRVGVKFELDIQKLSSMKLDEDWNDVEKVVKVGSSKDDEPTLDEDSLENVDDLDCIGIAFEP